MAELTTLEEKLAEVLGLAQAAEMMETYLGEDADGLDGFEFMTMAEAGEVSHWAVLAGEKDPYEES